MDRVKISYRTTKLMRNFKISFTYETVIWKIKVKSCVENIQKILLYAYWKSFSGVEKEIKTSNESDQRSKKNLS